MKPALNETKCVPDTKVYALTSLLIVQMVTNVVFHNYFRDLYFTYRWTQGSLKAIWPSFTSNPLDSDRAGASRRACWTALPPSSLRTPLTPATNLYSRLTTLAPLDSEERRKN